jgi:serine protease Do
MEWRNYVEPSLPKIYQTNQDEFQSRLTTNPATGIFVISLQSEPSQKIRKEKRSSTFVSGRQVVPNPEYLDLQRRHQQGNMEYQNCNANYRVQALTNPYAINLCVIMIPALNNIQRSLSATSPTLTQTLTSPYEFDIDNVTVSVKSTIFLATYSAQSKGFMVTSISDTRSKDFVFAKNIHPNDEQVNRKIFAEEDEVRKFIAPQTPDLQKEWLESLTKKSTRMGNGELVALTKSSTKKVSEADGQIKISKEPSAPSSLDGMLSQSIVVVLGRESQGTGFFVRPRYILTNEHVVENQTVVEIERRDSSKITGVVVATDPILDLALIAVPANGAPLEMLRGTAKTGDEAFALGHPQGLKFSLTRGIISAVRAMKLGPGGATSATFLQTDVAINPGNSGGPLISGGRVVGINTFKIAGKNTEGLGFALSANVAATWLEKNLPK